MANGIGSLLERYGNPQTKAELAGSVLAGVSPAGGLLDAITSALAVKEGEYGKAALYALGASLPFVSGSPLSKLFKRMIDLRKARGGIYARLTGKEADQLFELDATPKQVGQADAHIRFGRGQSVKPRLKSAKTTPHAERTFNRSGTTPRVRGRGYDERSPKQRQADYEEMQMVPVSATESIPFLLGGEKRVLDKNWPHLWAPESLPEQRSLWNQADMDEEKIANVFDALNAIKAGGGRPIAKAPLTGRQMRSLDFPLGANQDDVATAAMEEFWKLSAKQKAKYPLSGSGVVNPRYAKLLKDIALNPRTLARTAKQEEKIAKILAKGGDLTESEMQELYEWAIQPGLEKFNRVLPLAPEQHLLEQGYDMTGYYGSALTDDVGKGIMSLPVTKTNLGQGSVVTTDPNLAIRYAQRGPGKGIVSPLRFKSEYAIPMESGPGNPLSRYFIGEEHPTDYILNKPLSLEEFIASIS